MTRGPSTVWVCVVGVDCWECFYRFLRFLSSTKLVTCTLSQPKPAISSNIWILQYSSPLVQLSAPNQYQFSAKKCIKKTSHQSKYGIQTRCGANKDLGYIQTHPNLTPCKDFLQKPSTPRKGKAPQETKEGKEYLKSDFPLVLPLQLL